MLVDLTIAIMVQKCKFTIDNTRENEHCGHGFVPTSIRNAHTKIHERQDGETQLWQDGDVKCTILFDVKQKGTWIIITTEGIGAKLESETKLAEFFDAMQIQYDRDWVNRISFKQCQAIKGKQSSPRSDFFF